MESTPEKKAPKSPNRKTLVLGSTAVAALGLLTYFIFIQDTNGQRLRGRGGKQITLEQIPFDGAASLQWIERLCAIGPRVSGTEGMKKQQEMLVAHFESLGGKVEMQRFPYRNPQTGEKIEMANLIVRWHPDRKERIMFCAHYDTRPFPDEDPVNPRGVFVGANDGGSGVSVLAELGKHMPNFNSKLGVDFVLFDGEELIYDKRRDRYFVGSEVFARQYAADKNRDFKYRAAVLLDMVGDKSLQLYQERNGLQWRDSRWIVLSIWKKAKQLGVVEFIHKPWNKSILDDHIMLHQHGKIPACDLIDFAFGTKGLRNDYWHTTNDTPDKCSALSLAKVGWVIHEWLKDQGKNAK